MGASVRNVIHVNYVISAALAGIGGALAAITVGHIDPEMAYWTTSGEFVFVAILSGTGSVLAPFLGAPSSSRRCAASPMNIHPTPGRWRWASPCSW